MSMTADDVRNAVFRGARFQRGYDSEEVDDLLDRIVARLECLERGEEPTPELPDAEDIAEHRFTETSWSRPGYNVEDVDALLRAVADRLRRCPERSP